MKAGLCLFVLAIGVAGADPEMKSAALQVEGGTQIALWQVAPNPNKPYIAQLFAPGKMPIPLLHDSPPDHFHHHGLMFALSVDDTDFWTEKGGGKYGRQDEAGALLWPDKSGGTHRLHWNPPGDTSLLLEVRKIQVRATGQGDDTVHWLDWQSKLTPAADRKSVRLTGDHYFGLGMRFLPAWSGKGAFLWQDTAGQKVVRGDEKLTPGQWCAVQCEIDGRPVTVLMIDHPANSRPVRWFTMAKPFCYLSATNGLDTEPAVLKAGETWTMHYGIAVLTGKADRARLTMLAAEWKTRSTELNGK